MGFYKTFILPVIKERFDLEEKPSITFDKVTKEIDFVSNQVYKDWNTVGALYLTNLN